MHGRKPTLLLIGLGGLGRVILQFAARSSALGRIVGADINANRGETQVNLARAGALAQGYEPDLGFAQLDLRDTAAAAETIARVRPDLLLSTASLQTWWLVNLLPPDAAAPLRQVRFGAWLPVHLALTFDLMRAVRLAGYEGPVLTAPLPDVVNPVLACLGLAPACGIGNVDEIVPKVQWLAADRLRVLRSSVQVFLVAHHAVEPMAFGEASTEVPPHYLRILHDGEDVTEAVDGERLLLSPWPLPQGPSWHFLTAASAVRLIEAMTSETPVPRHAPAPGGLPGGYPIVVSTSGIRVADIPGVRRAEAVAINEAAHRFDGVERIEPDGTAVFVEAAVDLMRRTLGYDCARLSPADATARAQELQTRFREYAARWGVDLDRIAAAVV